MPTCLFFSFLQFFCSLTYILSANVGGKLGSVSGSVFTISGVSFEKANVKCDDFWDIARTSKANVNNSKDEYIRLGIFFFSFSLFFVCFVRIEAQEEDAVCLSGSVTYSRVSKEVNIKRRSFIAPLLNPSFRADAEHVIIDRALSRMGTIGYNMLWSNCEHFASWCRYGMAWSEQVDKFMRVLDR